MSKEIEDDDFANDNNADPMVIPDSPATLAKLDMIVAACKFEHWTHEELFDWVDKAMNTRSFTIFDLRKTYKEAEQERLKVVMG